MPGGTINISSLAQRRCLGFICEVGREVSESGLDAAWIDRISRDCNCLGTFAAQLRERLGQLREAVAEHNVPFFAPNDIQFFPQRHEAPGDVVDLLEHAEQGYASFRGPRAAGANRTPNVTSTFQARHEAVVSDRKRQIIRELPWRCGSCPKG